MQHCSRAIGTVLLAQLLAAPVQAGHCDFVPANFNDCNTAPTSCVGIQPTLQCVQGGGGAWILSEPMAQMVLATHTVYDVAIEVHLEDSVTPGGIRDSIVPVLNDIRLEGSVSLNATTGIIRWSTDTKCNPLDLFNRKNCLELVNVWSETNSDAVWVAMSGGELSRLNGDLDGPVRFAAGFRVNGDGELEVLFKGIAYIHAEQDGTLCEDPGEPTEQCIDPTVDCEHDQQGFPTCYFERDVPVTLNYDGPTFPDYGIEVTGAGAGPREDMEFGRWQVDPTSNPTKIDFLELADLDHVAKDCEQDYVEMKIVFKEPLSLDPPTSGSPLCPSP